MLLKDARHAINVAIQKRNSLRSELAKVERRITHHTNTYNAIQAKIDAGQRARERALEVYDGLSKNERLELYVCTRKALYILPAHAKLKCADDQSTYACVFCTGYHNGHPPKAGSGLNPRKGNVVEVIAQLILKGEI